MKTLYKLTNAKMQTHNQTQWVLGEWRKTDGAGDLCGPGWLHAYADPLLAVLLNHAHANFNPGTMRLFKAAGRGKFKNDRGLKCGVTELRIVEEITVPVVTVDQKIAFGILCTTRVYKDKAWRVWARGWLSGRDRSYAAADTAANAAYAAAANAAYAAANAANAAAYAAAKPLPLARIAKLAMKKGGPK